MKFAVANALVVFALLALLTSMGRAALQPVSFGKPQPSYNFTSLKECSEYASDSDQCRNCCRQFNLHSTQGRYLMFLDECKCVTQEKMAKIKARLEKEDAKEKAKYEFTSPKSCKNYVAGSVCAECCNKFGLRGTEGSYYIPSVIIGDKFRVCKCVN